jgi:hypothetical protein
MINYREIQANTVIIISITCDVCGKEYDDQMDVQEFNHIDFTGGYASVFGDMARIKCDICQNCLKKMIGQYCYYETEDGLKRFDS